MPSHSSSAFTLIELLVVITIVVILIALLTPALDKAVYQAEMALCSANMKGIVTGVGAYGVAYRRTYPHRSALVTLVADQRPHTLYSGQAADGVDDRRLLGRHIPLDMFVDPFCEALELDPQYTAPDSFVYASYALWFNWQYAGERGMLRLGDRFTWQDKTFDIMVSDTDAMSKGGDGTFAHNGHPDEDGLLVRQKLQDQREFGISWTFSFWTRSNAWLRGPVDRNFAFTDGSVERIEKVKIHRDANSFDPRVIQVPMRMNKHPGSWEHLPGP